MTLFNILFIIIQCSWGMIQTTIGLITFLLNKSKPHYFYHGAIITEWKYLSSVSLGLFVFVSAFSRGNGDNGHLALRYRKLVIHEYGHCIQSLILGPIYLIVIGLPSFLWGNLPYFRHLRRRRHLSYYSFYTEKNANYWGTKVVKEDIQAKDIL